MSKEIEIVLNQPHEAQQRILDGAKRYNVLTCGRRFGKSSLAIELLAQSILDGHIVGLWTPTYKDLYELWQEAKHVLYPITKSKDEQVKQLKAITGGKLDCWSLEEPDNGRGRKYHRVIIDEAEKSTKLKEAWERAIRPTLTDFRGDAWFLSTPKFGQTYFKELHKKPETSSTWTSWRFTTYDNPYMNRAEIDEARETLDDLTFRCEYLAEDVDLTLRPFAYAFDQTKHVGECAFENNKHVWLSFDFNVDPLTCIAAHCDNFGMKIFREWSITSGDIYEICERVKIDLPSAVFLVTGDSTGAGRSALTKGNTNYYTVIKRALNLVDTQLKKPNINPSIGDSRVHTNSMLQHFPVVISPECKGLIRDLRYVEMDEEGDLIKDRKTDTRKADLLDCFRYLINSAYPNYLKRFF